MGDRLFEAEADLELALLEYFRAQGIDEDALVEEVEVVFQELNRQVREGHISGH